MRGKRAKRLRRFVYGEEFSPRHRETKSRLVKRYRTEKPDVFVDRFTAIADERRRTYKWLKRFWTRHGIDPTDRVARNQTVLLK